MINQFKNEYFFLSNFYETPVKYDGLTYSNNEAAFQAQKTMDMTVRQRFTQMDPIEARNEGKNLKLRSDWEEIKDKIMYDICNAKFKQNPELMDRLVFTGKRPLEEGNHWNDRYWGTVNGVGDNKLGEILMKIRSNEISKRDKEWDR